jgi:hypothetical protein
MGNRLRAFPMLEKRFPDSGKNGFVAKISQKYFFHESGAVNHFQASEN